MRWNMGFLRFPHIVESSHLADGLLTPEAKYPLQMRPRKSRFDSVDLMEVRSKVSGKTRDIYFVGIGGASG
jgi:hypothetical protein